VLHNWRLDCQWWWKLQALRASVYPEFFIILLSSDGLRKDETKRRFSWIGSMLWVLAALTVWASTPSSELEDFVGAKFHCAYVLNFGFKISRLWHLWIEYARRGNKKHALCQVVRLKWKVDVEQVVVFFCSVMINTAVCLRQATAAVSVENRVTEGDAVVSSNSNTSTNYAVLNSGTCTRLTGFSFSHSSGLHLRRSVSFHTHT